MTARTTVEIVTALVVSVVCAWLFWPEPAGEPHLPAAPAPEVAGETKLATPIRTPTVRAYKPEIKKKLALPKPIQADPAKVVLDSTRVEATRHATTLTTVLDTTTGEATTLARREPLPWLAPDGVTRLWLGAGYTPAGPVARLDAEQGLVNIKDWRVSVRGVVDLPLSAANAAPTWFAGVGIGMELE